MPTWARVASTAALIQLLRDPTRTKRRLALDHPRLDLELALWLEDKLRGGGVTLDHERARMQGEVMALAKRDEVRERVRAAVHEKQDVMHIDVRRRAASRHAAAIAIAMQRVALDRLRNTPRGASRLIVEAADVNAVAQGALHLGWREHSRAVRAVLPALLASLADRHRNLISGATTDSISASVRSRPPITMAPDDVSAATVVGAFSSTATAGDRSRFIERSSSH